MPRRCPDVSSPHLHRGRDLRCCAPGKTDAGHGGLRAQLEQPGVLLLRCLGPRRPEGSGDRHVRARWFGHAHLPMCVSCPRIYCGRLFSRGLVGRIRLYVAIVALVYTFVGIDFARPFAVRVGAVRGYTLVTG